MTGPHHLPRIRTLDDGLVVRRQFREGEALAVDGKPTLTYAEGDGWTLVYLDDDGRIRAWPIPGELDEEDEVIEEAREDLAGLTDLDDPPAGPPRFQPPV